MDVHSFLNDVNSLLPQIQFTLETEENRKISFLDVLIHRDGRDLSFSVYRKPTNNDSYIHSYSAHAMSVKRGMFIGMYRRAYSICSPEHLNSELDKIFNIGHSLKYAPEFLNDCNLAAQQTTTPAATNVNNNFLILPFHTGLQPLKSVFRDAYSTNLVFRYNNLKNMLISNKPRNNNAGIYAIPCGNNNCNSIYIGQSGNIEQRLTQHKRVMKSRNHNSNENKNNSLYLHKRIYGHDPDFDNTCIVVKSDNFYERTCIESAMIDRSFIRNINHKRGETVLDSYANQKLTVDALDNVKSTKILSNFLWYRLPRAQ